MRIFTFQLYLWFNNACFISDVDIFKKKGHDAFHYLMFQKHIIYFLMVLSFICMVVLLPINVLSSKGKLNI